MGLRDRIAKLSEITLDIQYGGEQFPVLIRSLAYGELIEIRNVLAHVDEKTRDEEIGLEVVARSVFDPETGEPAFTRQDLRTLPWSVVSDLSAAARTMNNFASATDAKKNLNGAQRPMRRSRSRSGSTARSRRS